MKLGEGFRVSRIWGPEKEPLREPPLPLLRLHLRHLDFDPDPGGTNSFASARRPSSSLACLTSATWTSVKDVTACCLKHSDHPLSLT